MFQHFVFKLSMSLLSTILGLFNRSYNISYRRVKRNAATYFKKFQALDRQEQIRIGGETDRLFNRGAYYWNMGNRTLALEYFAQALEIFPINTDVIGMYGDYYMDSDINLSMKFYQLAIRYNSFKKKDYDQLAKIFRMKGLHDKADACHKAWEYILIKYNICGE